MTGLLAPAGNTPGGHMPLAQGIIATAQALGMNPADLATVISYETAGTFDPTKRGPTTQWGEHRGLIQFGEPQAQEYGVDWSDPVGSQLGPDGAVARYFRENGWRPGMGLLDAYSIVNAGGPGRYNASDANNGGAPGTVADKVNEQMGGHRENAMRLLDGLIDPRIADAFAGQGGTAQSASTGSGGLLSMPPAPERQPSIWDRFEGKPGLGWLADPTRRADFAIALEGLRLDPNEGRIASLQQGIEDTRASEERRRLAAWLASQPGGANAAALIGAGADPSAAAQWYVESQTPQPPIIEGDMVLDPTTGALIADYRQPEPGQRRIVEQGGVQYYADTGEPVLPNAPAPEGKGGPELSDVTGFQTSYRGEEAVKRMQAMANAYGSMQVAAQNNDHMALVYAYVKMLDPTSVVRETETGMVASSSSIDQSLLGQINGWLNGEPLPPQVVERIMGTAEGMYNDAAAPYAEVYNSYAGMAEFYGLPPEHGPIDYRREWEPISPLAAPEAAPAASTAPAPAPAAAPAPPQAPAPAAAPPAVDATRVPTMTEAEIDAILDGFEASGVPIPPMLVRALDERLQNLEMEGR